MERMRFVTFARRITAILGFALVCASAAAQSANETKEEMIVRRYAIWRQAVTAANSGQFDKAHNLFEQVFEIEQSVFGENHSRLLRTLDVQAQTAHDAKNWQREIEYRRRAVNVGAALYKKGDYRLGDLDRSLIEAEANASRTD